MTRHTLIEALDPRIFAPPASPVSSGKATLWGTVDPSTIIKRYGEHGIDVTGYFSGLGQVPIFECADTGYRFFHPQSLAGEADFYEQLYDPQSSEQWVDPDYRKWAEDYQYAYDRIVPGERLLDVGCGYGYFLRRAVEKAEVAGIDGSKFAQAHCQNFGLDVHLGSVSDYRERLAGSFDTVCSFQVLEHVYDVREFMTDLIALVKPGGRLIIAVPNNEPYIRRFDPYNTWNCPPHHIGLWNRKSLEAMGRLFELTPTEHQYCEVSGRWVVEGYLHARYILGLKSDIHEHSISEKLAILAFAPYTLPLSLWRHWRKGGRGTRNVIAMTFVKEANPAARPLPQV